MLPSLVSVSLALIYFFRVSSSRRLFKRRSVRVYQALMVAVMFWSTGNVVEILATTVEGKLLGVCIAFPGVVMLPVAWLLWVCHYIEQCRWLFPRRWVWLTIIPLLAVLLAFTHPWHSLMWVDPELVSVGDAASGYISWRSSHGPAWFVQVAYSYLMVAVSLLLIARGMYQEPWSRGQLAMLALSVLAPVVASVLFLVVVPREVLPVDLTVAFFAVAFVWMFVTLEDPVRRLIPGSLRLVVERLNSPIFVVNEDQQVVYQNQAGAELALSSGDWMAGDVMADLIEVEGAGGTRFFETRFLPVDVHGLPRATVAVLSDMTDETELELAMTLANEASLRRAEELEIRATDKTRFLAGVSHELRSPLSAAVGIAQLLKDDQADPLTEEERELSRRISASGRGLLEQINRLLDFEKAEAGALVLNVGTVTPEAFLSGLQGALMILMSSAGIRHQVRTRQDSAGQLHLDTLKTRQILTGITSFLCETCQVGAEIQVSLHLDDSGLTAHYTQEGTDLRLGDFAQLRDPFSALDDDVVVPAGREQRVAIALVTRLVDLLHGRVLLEQQVNRTRWQVHLPNLSDVVSRQ